MRRSKHLLALAVMILAYSCNSDDPLDDADLGQQLMVEAYVFANEPVNHVKVAKINEGGDAGLVPINDANVKLTQGSVNATLQVRSDEDGLYEIADSALVFSGSEPLRLEIIHEGKTYTSLTSFPPAIDSLMITNDYVSLTEVPVQETPLTKLSWTAPEGARAYCLFARGLANNDSAYPVAHDDVESPLFNILWDNSIELYADHFTHVGTYQLYVSAANSEYVQMYPEGSESELRGAPTNIDGAWGVFTAFNGQAVNITVE